MTAGERLTEELAAKRAAEVLAKAEALNLRPAKIRTVLATLLAA